MRLMKLLVWRVLIMIFVAVCLAAAQRADAVEIELNTGKKMTAKRVTFDGSVFVVHDGSVKVRLPATNPQFTSMESMTDSGA